MIDRRTAGVAAVLVPFWFLAVYLVLASLHPGFSHLTKAVSELGAWGAPHMWWWNVLGYGVSGLAIACLGLGLGDLRGRAGRVVACALVASGLLMTLSGVFPGDFDNRTAPSMVAHLLASIGSYVAFLVAGIAFPIALRRSPAWRGIGWPSLVLVVLSLVTGVLRDGDAPGLGQRLTFACFFLWIALVGGAAVRASRRQAQDGSRLHPA